MPANPATVNLTGARSWFNDTSYLLQDRLDNALKDPIFELFGEDNSPDKSDTISITGRDNLRTGKTKREGAQVLPEAPVEEDQDTHYFMTFEASQRYTYESLIHDKYRFAEEQPTELVDNVMRGASRLMHHQLFNSATATTVTMPGTAGAYDIALPDGQALFSAAHSGPGYSSKTNIGGTGALSTPNITQNIQIGVENFVSSTGERISFRPNALIVPDQAEMVEAGFQITRSDKVRETGNNSINWYQGGSMDLIVLKYAPETAASAYDSAKEYFWMTANLELLKKGLKYKFAERPRVLTKFMDPETGDSYITVLCRVAVYAKRWQVGVLNNSMTAPTHPGA